MKKIGQLLDLIELKWYQYIVATKIKLSLRHCGINVRVYGPVKIKNPGNLSIGNYCSFNDYTYINAAGCVSLGDNVSISSGVSIVSTSLEPSSLSMNFKQHINAPIKIGNNIQVGVGAIILMGVTIEDNVIVGAGSVVPPNKILRSNRIYVGNPVRELRKFNKIFKGDKC